MDQPNVIQSLWIGPALTQIEKLSIASFLENGNPYHLYIYNDVDGVPEGAIIKDANEILPSQNIFKCKKYGSYAAYSDWFRYELLFNKGGFWCDTDVVCLKRFNFDLEKEGLIVGREDSFNINNAVIGAKADLEIFKHLADRCKNPNKILPYDKGKVVRRKIFRKYFLGNKRNNVKWGENGPLALSSALKHFNTSRTELPFFGFYPIHCTCWKSIFDNTFESDQWLLDKSFAVHLWNEMSRRDKGFSKENKFPSGSLIEQWKEKYFQD